MTNYFDKFHDEQITTSLVKIENLAEALTAEKTCGLSVLHINIRSLDKHFVDLEALIRTHLRNIDVIVCTETWKIHHLQMYSLEGFHSYYNNGNINKNDGVVIYIKNNLKHSVNLIKINMTSLNEVNRDNKLEKREIIGNIQISRNRHTELYFRTG